MIAIAQSAFRSHRVSDLELVTLLSLGGLALSLALVCFGFDLSVGM